MTNPTWQQRFDEEFTYLTQQPDHKTDMMYPVKASLVKFFIQTEIDKARREEFEIQRLQCDTRVDGAYQQRLHAEKVAREEGRQVGIGEGDYRAEKRILKLIEEMKKNYPRTPEEETECQWWNQALDELKNKLND